MARSVSNQAKREIFAPQSGQAWVFLLTLSHPDLSAPIRLCNDGRDVASRGELYHQFPFEAYLPDDADDKPPVVRLRISGVDQRVVQAVRAVSSDLQVTIEVVMSGTPDVVEAGPFDFTLRAAQYDAMVVEGTLAYEDVFSEPYPGDSFTPSKFPGVFVA